MLAENAVIIAEQGNYLRIKARPLRGMPRDAAAESARELVIPPQDGQRPLDDCDFDTKRGKIKGMSAASRKRLFDQLNQIKRKAFASALFVTLTYPGKWVDDWQQWKRDLQALLKRLFREYPRAATLWRLEFQARGAPHFHFFVFNVRFIPYEQIALWWYEIVNSGDPRHLKAGTEVRRVQNRRKALHYVAKYMAKRGESDERYTGRVWGIRGGKYLPVLLHTVFVDDDAFRMLQSILRDVFQELVGRDAEFCYGRAGITVYIPERRALGILAFCIEKVSKIEPPG